VAHLIHILAHCPFCKDAMDELQAQAMRVSIFLLLGMIYSLAGIIAFKVIRMMAREERELQAKAAKALPVPDPAPQVLATTGK
jgi:hypothetical protein